MKGVSFPASVLVVALVGCDAQAPMPSVLAVSPSSFTAGAAVELTVTGTDFHPVVRGDLSAPDQGELDLAFDIALTEGDLEAALVDIEWIDDRELRGWAPDGLIPGSYAIRVIDPRGASAVLSSAITVLAADDSPVDPDPSPVLDPLPDPLPDPDPVDSDLVLHLELEDGSGTSAVDASGNGNDGTLIGEATWTTGRNGAGVQVDYTDGIDFIEGVRASAARFLAPNERTSIGLLCVTVRDREVEAPAETALVSAGARPP